MGKGSWEIMALDKNIYKKILIKIQKEAPNIFTKIV